MPPTTGSAVLIGCPHTHSGTPLRHNTSHPLRRFKLVSSPDMETLTKVASAPVDNRQDWCRWRNGRLPSTARPPTV